VLGNDCEIDLTGPQYRDFQETKERAEMLCEQAHPYLVEVDETVRKLYVYKKKENQAANTGDADAIVKGHDLMIHLSVTSSSEERQYFSRI
jgi:hypothetical protein